MTSKSKSKRIKKQNTRSLKFTLSSIEMTSCSMPTSEGLQRTSPVTKETVTQKQPSPAEDKSKNMVSANKLNELSNELKADSAFETEYKSTTKVTKNRKMRHRNIDKDRWEKTRQNDGTSTSSSTRRVGTLPKLHIPVMVHRQRTSDLLRIGVEGDHLLPASKAERRVTLARNNMYGNFLRQSTKKLQDDLRQTMRTYSTEKQQLLRHLASLRHEMDGLQVSRSSSPTSSVTDASSGSYVNLRKPKRYFHAPNVAAHKMKKSSKSKERKNSDSVSEKRPKDGILKLPSIIESQPSFPAGPRQNSEWDSGQQISLNNLPPIDPPEGIAAAKALLKDTYIIPKIDDPTRRDYSLSSQRDSIGKDKEKKKVQFSERDQINVITPSEKRMQRNNSDSDSKNSDTTGESNESSPQLRKKKSGVNKRHYLPPLDLGNRKKVLSPQETEDHKMLYISIKDPEARTKTLSEILHAVRIRMQENEQHLRFGEIPRQNKLNNTYEFLMSTSLESPSPTRSERQGNNSRLGVPQNTAARLGRRSNAMQLQNYLRKMSKSRRMIEHMEAEEYRLAHIMGHKELMAVTRNSQPIMT